MAECGAVFIGRYCVITGITAAYMACLLTVTLWQQCKPLKFYVANVR
jgi:hypothetical protein